MLNQCSDKYTTMSLPPLTLTCVREVDDLGRHVGRHFAYEVMDGWRRLWIWSSGGAQGLTRQGTERATLCSICATPHDDGRYADVNPETDTSVCFNCREWERRVQQYHSKKNMTLTEATATRTDFVLIRPRNAFFRPNWLYSWSFRVNGAFGNRPCRVVMDDGREFGPASRLWGSGEIPWWLDEEFPPNCQSLTGL